MWRRILLTAVLILPSAHEINAAQDQVWAGLDFAKSLRNNHLPNLLGQEWLLLPSEPPAGYTRLTSSESPLPDTTVIPPLKQHFEYVLPGTCVSAISAGKDFKCTGRDKDHLVCSGMVVTVRGKVDDCLQINVVKEQ